MGGMRGGGRLMCSPYLTGALGILVVLVGFNYWSASTQNHDLLVNVSEMQQQLRVGSDRIGSQEDKLKSLLDKLSAAQTKNIQFEEKSAKLEREVKALKKEIKKRENSQNIEKKNLDDQITRLTEENDELQKGKDNLQEKSEKLQEENDALKSKMEGLTKTLQSESEKAADLQSRLAELLSQNPSVINSKPQGDGSHELGPGQLPDVDPHAVSVVKKDTLGGAGLRLDPVDNVAPPPNQQVNFASEGPKGISSSSSIAPSSSDKAVESAVKQLTPPGGLAADDESLENTNKELSSGEVKEDNTNANQQIEADEDIKGDNLDRKEADSGFNLDKAGNGMSNEEDDNAEDQDPAGDLLGGDNAAEADTDGKPAAEDGEEKKVEEYNMF